MSKDKNNAFERAGEKENPSLWGDLFRMVKENKKYWMIPIVLLVLGIGVLIILGGTGAAPFIYTLF